MNRTRSRRLPWMLFALLLLPAAWACEVPQSGPPAAAGSASEAERTRKIEEKAAEIRRHEEEIRNMTGSDQEKIDAVNRLDKERQELADMQNAK